MPSKLSLNIFKDKAYISRAELISYIKKQTKYEKDSSIRWVINDLIKEGSISKINQHYFYNGHLKEFTPKDISKSKSKIEAILKKKYPMMDIVIYESGIMNNWINHQITKNIIFVQTEKAYTQYVFDVLKEEMNNQVLMNPSVRDMDMYSENNTIIVSNLTTRSPMRKDSYDIRLEKLIVDIFRNDLISEFLSQTEYDAILSSVFKQYKIDTKTLLSYAKRRKIDKLMDKYIKEYIPGKEN